MTTKVEAAKAFALSCHATQKYGKEPYAVHLETVVNAVRLHGKDIEIHHEMFESYVAAAWCHDVLEDTGTDLHKLLGVIGDEATLIVWCVTGIGATRKERNESMYRKVSAHHNEGALLVKLADRVANVEACMPTSQWCRSNPALRLGDPEKLAMYAKEYPAFRGALRQVGRPHTMWSKLDQLLSFESFGVR